MIPKIRSKYQNLKRNGYLDFVFSGMWGIVFIASIYIFVQQSKG